jgi:hypothetical protein
MAYILSSNPICLNYKVEKNSIGFFFFIIISFLVVFIPYYGNSFVKNDTIKKKF